MPDGDLAQPSAELDLGRVVETLLAAHEQHLVRHQRLTQGEDLVVVEAGEVEAMDLGTEVRAERGEGQLRAHGRSFAENAHGRFLSWMVGRRFRPPPRP